ncbi:MAG: histidinol dehydrogenase [Bacteroidales bacterium]|nr:histidinol dehydrogenase [Bacteroidales bacterium]
MQTIKYPSRAEWPELMKRAVADTRELHDTVANILAAVRNDGDKALRDFAERFDKVALNDLRVSEAEIEAAKEMLSDELKMAIDVAAANISKFHSAQVMQDISVETSPGVVCTQRMVPIADVGLYIPGGNSPLFSTVLMLAMPARIAGCKNVVMCTPAGKDGKVHPAILYAAWKCGVANIFKSGGAQAVAAMAYGTESVPRVSKIFGPGNRFVMEAKMQVNSDGVAIDMPAGPSEVMVVADAEADARFVASDFLSQAEHGPDSQSILLTTDAAFAERLPKVIDEMLATLPRQEMMKKSLSHSHIILLKDNDEVMDFVNDYAPEHLIINTVDADLLAERVENAGSVFLGPYSPESAGDYASGTNHTLPTSGYAKAYSGVNIDSFTKKITFQRLSKAGLEGIGKAVEAMAEAEDLMAHRLAVAVRLGDE